MSFCKKASDLVNGNREADYGHPAENFQRIADLWTTLFGRAFTREDVALAMTAVKMARLATSPTHEDSWIDICGYAECVSRFSERIVGFDPATGEDKTVEVKVDFTALRGDALNEAIDKAIRERLPYKVEEERARQFIEDLANVQERLMRRRVTEPKLVPVTPWIPPKGPTCDTSPEACDVSPEAL